MTHFEIMGDFCDFIKLELELPDLMVELAFVSGMLSPLQIDRKSTRLNSSHL